MKNLPGEVADGGEVKGDGHALLAVEDPVCCSRRRQDFCHERGFPNVAFMEDERSTVQLACAIYLLLLYCDAGVAPSAGPKGRLLLDMRGAHLMPLPVAGTKGRLLTGSATCWAKVRLRSTCCRWSRRDIDKERVLVGIGID
uniref:Uncharacterized protein n=1 Tax=Populus trichocarpa TaxID=3694 RepID=A0A2K1R5X7_POPTR